MGYTSITLSWSKVKNASGYYVYKKTGSGYKKIGSTKNLVYKVKKVELNTNYTFKVTPYVSNNGSATTGTGATVKIKSAKSAYLMDIAPPYKCSQNFRYNDYSQTKFVMGGTSYTHGFLYDLTYAYDESVYINLKGKYKTLSFISGVTDNSYGDGTIYLYSDGDLIASYKQKSNELPKSHSFNVSECIQLTIRVEHSGDSCEYGFANIKISK